ARSEALRVCPFGSASSGSCVTADRSCLATSAASAYGTPASDIARSESRAERSSFSERSGRYTASWNQAARRTTSGSPAYSASSSTRSRTAVDRKSTRLNSSHVKISYAVFCLKKKKHKHVEVETKEVRNQKT